MFICDECLRKYYENDPSWIGSRGPCECCGQTKRCNDIPSSRLVNKGRIAGKKKKP